MQYGPWSAQRSIHCLMPPFHACVHPPPFWKKISYKKKKERKRVGKASSLFKVLADVATPLFPKKKVSFCLPSSFPEGTKRKNREMMIRAKKNKTLPDSHRCLQEERKQVSLCPPISVHFAWAVTQQVQQQMTSATAAAAAAAATI